MFHPPNPDVNPTFERSRRQFSPKKFFRSQNRQFGLKDAEGGVFYEVWLVAFVGETNMPGGTARPTSESCTKKKKKKKKNGPKIQKNALNIMAALKIFCKFCVVVFFCEPTGAWLTGHVRRAK